MNGVKNVSNEKKRCSSSSSSSRGVRVAADNVAVVGRASKPLPDKAREKQERYQVTIGSWGSQARISFEV